MKTAVVLRISEVRAGQSRGGVMRKTIIVATIWPLLLFLMPHTLRTEEPWQQVLTYEEGKILVYTKTTPDFPVKACRGITTVSASLSTLVTIIADADAYPEWMHNVTHAKVLRQFSDTERLIYTIQQTPWPLADRDLVSFATLKQDSKTRQVAITVEALPDEYPMQSQYVRVPKMMSRWQLTPLEKGLTSVVYDIYADPGGKIPAYIVNTCAVDTPLNTLKGLHRMVKKTKYRDASVDFIREW